jgi:putative protein kinase ArgK-like GTPase of G3E family
MAEREFIQKMDDKELNERFRLLEWQVKDLKKREQGNAWSIGILGIAIAIHGLAELWK